MRFSPTFSLGGGWDDPNCARRTSTFLSCAFREQRDRPSYPLLSLLKDQPRLRHIPHRDRHQLPPARSELVQSGLHILGVRKNIDDFVLEPFRLLCLRCKQQRRHKQKPQRTKTDSCYQPRPRKTYVLHFSPRVVLYYGCATFQLCPVPRSTFKGTDNPIFFPVASISVFTSCFASSSSFSGTSKINSSWTWRIIFVCGIS